MPNAEWFTMMGGFANYGIECWLKEFMESQVIYLEFQASSDFIIIDSKHPMCHQFDEWMSIHRKAERTHLMFIANRRGAKGEDGKLCYIYEYYNKWCVADTEL